jgi:hypothetical protein
MLGILPPYVAEQIAKHVITWPVRKLAQFVCELQPTINQSVIYPQSLQRQLLDSTPTFAVSTIPKNVVPPKHSKKCSLSGRSVNPAPLDPPGTSVTVVIGPIPEHCTF